MKTISKTIDKGDYFSVKGKDIKLKRIKNTIVVKYQPDTDHKKLRDMIKKTLPSQKEFRSTQMSFHGFCIYSFSDIDEENMDELDKELKKSKDIAFVSPLFYHQESDSKVILTDEIIIKLKEEDVFDQKYAKNHLESILPFNLKIDRSPRNCKNTYIVKADKDVDVLKTVKSLNKTKMIEYAEPNFLTQIHFSYYPGDPNFPDQWHLDYNGHSEGDPDADIQACAAWDLAQGMGSPGVVVAVIDDGVEIDHEDLIDNIWTNPGEIPNNTVDDDGNGYIDDVHGWNFAFKNNDPNPLSLEGHGTCCAGIIAATEGNGKGGVGVAPRITLLPVKVGSKTGPAIWTISTQQIDSGSFGGSIDFDLIDIPLPLADVLLTVEAEGDLNASVEYVTVWGQSTNGTTNRVNLGNIFLGPASQCMGTNIDQLLIPKTIFESLFDILTGDITVTLEPSINVNFGCNFKASIELNYLGQYAEYTYSDTIGEAVRYAADHADVLSCSWRALECSFIEDAFIYATHQGRGGKGCPSFAASGNFGTGFVTYSLQQTTGLTLTPGWHTFTWVYEKDASLIDNDDTVWIDRVEFPDGYIEDFGSASLPEGWITFGYAPWSNVNDNIHYAVGADGRCVKAGTIGNLQFSALRITRYIYTEGDIKYWAWVSSEMGSDIKPGDNLTLYIYKEGDIEVPFPFGGGDSLKASDPENFLGKVYFPANLSDTIAVGGSTSCNLRTFYSNFGNELDVVAPTGGGPLAIFTTDVMGGYGYVPKDYWEEFQGTSASCPIAAGIGALLLSAEPNLTAEEVRIRIRSTADKIGPIAYNQSGWNQFFGYGKVNAYKALKFTTSDQIYDETTDVETSGSEGGTINITFTDVLNNPTTDALLTVRAKGDLNSTSEYITVYAESLSGTNLGVVFNISDMSSCDEFNEQQIIIDRSTLQSLASDGQITFCLQASTDVNCCCNLEACLKLQYAGNNLPLVFDETTPINNAGSYGGNLYFTLSNAAANPTSDGRLTIWTMGDLNSTTENVTVYADGINLGIIYNTGNDNQCDTYNRAEIIISQSTLQSLASDGQISFVLDPSSGVNCCCNFEAYIRLQYGINGGTLPPPPEPDPISEPDSWEPDDSFSSANEISVYETQNHSIIPEDDEDYLYFDLPWYPYPPYVTIETSGPSDDDTRLWVYNASGVEIAFDDDSGDGCFSRLVLYALPAGRWYIKVDEYGNNDEIESYEISLDVYF